MKISKLLLCLLLCLRVHQKPLVIDEHLHPRVRRIGGGQAFFIERIGDLVFHVFHAQGNHHFPSFHGRREKLAAGSGERFAE